MESALDYTKKFGSWGQDKWNGTFQIKWTYIKDIPNSQFRHIVLANNENKPVTNSRDTQEVLLEPGADWRDEDDGRRDGGRGEAKRHHQTERHVEHREGALEERRSRRAAVEQTPKRVDVDEPSEPVIGWRRRVPIKWPD